MKLWSNLFFLIPLVVALYNHLYWYALILGTVFIISLVFHFIKENRILYYLDASLSAVLMVANFALLFMGQWSLPFSLLAVIMALLALFFYFRKGDNYDFNHSLWHIFSAGVCLFCLLTI